MAEAERKIPWKVRRFFVHYARTGNATEAANIVYKCKNDNVAAVQGSNLLRKYKIELTAMLDAHGLTDDKIAAEVAKAVEAKETKFAIHEGKFTDEREVVNVAEHRKGLELVTKLKGHLTNKIQLELPPEVKIQIDPEYVATKPEGAE